MRSRGRAHPLTKPMVPASPHQLREAVIGGVTLTAGLPGLASWLRLSSSFPSHSLLTHATTRPCVAGTTHAGLEGGRGRESGSTTGPTATPPPGIGNTVTRV